LNEKEGAGGRGGGRHLALAPHVNYHPVVPRAMTANAGGAGGDGGGGGGGEREE
jgi:hypothetical protein